MAGNSQVPRVPGGDAVEAVHIPQLAKQLPCESSIEDIAAWVTDAEIGQSLDVRVWKWMKKDAVDYAEDRDSGSDAQRQGKDRSQSEPGILDQLPKGITNVRSGPPSKRAASAAVTRSFVTTRLPKRTRASRRASSGDMPATMLSSVRSAMWV